MFLQILMWKAEEGCFHSAARLQKHDQEDFNKTWFCFKDAEQVVLFWCRSAFVDFDVLLVILPTINEKHPGAQSKAESLFVPKPAMA